MRSPLLGRLVTSPIAFLLGAIAELMIYAVARDGKRIVAAGRGQVPKLKPGAKAPFAVYFIGDPRAGKLTLAAPPTVLDAGS